MSVRITDLTPDLIDGNTGDGGARGFRAVAHVSSPDPGDSRQLPVRLTLRDGLIAEICILDEPPSIEVLYFDGCPNHETFLPRLQGLLAEHHITARVTLIRISDHDDAQAHRFLGSPTVRVNGYDVDRAVAGQELADARHDGDDNRYAMQCRLYLGPEGIRGAPPDQWILDALIGRPHPPERRRSVTEWFEQPNAT